ncbi:hypothetical protein WR25_01164 [Diploscapter pachys]|uniref:Uncharacterized protein n=1 Tax=Diploscapter pachys TaxID=2018661 RepID=A0A2A2JY40_9BILA|nr:hypothetical protein WR25_01164 [Diploscapter pachys]
MGSSLPLRACSVRSTVKRLSASCLPIAAGATAPLASPGAAALKPSLAARLFSGESPTYSSKRSLRASTFSLANSLDSPSRALRRLGAAVHPAALDGFLDLGGQVGDRRRTPRQAVQGVGQVAGQARRLDVELADDAVQVAVLQLQQLVQPVRQFDIGVAPQLAEHRGGLDGLVVGIVRRPAEPGIEPQALAGIELQRGHLALRENEVEVPVQFLAQVLGDPRGQLDERLPAGEQGVVLVEGQRAQAQAELVLAVPDVAAQAQVDTQAVGAHAELAAFRQLQPLADVFLELHRHAEVAGQDAAQAIRVAGLRRQVAGPVQLGGIGQRPLALQLRLTAAAEGGQARGPVIVARAVMADGRPGLGPGAIEQAQQAVVEDIEEALAGRVGVVALALAHVLGQARWLVVVGRDRGQRRRGEAAVQALAQAHRFVGQAQRVAEAGQLGVLRLEATQRLEEIVRPAPGLGFPAHDLASFAGAQHGFGEAVDRHIAGQEALEHRAQQEHTGAAEGVLVERQGDLQATAEDDRPGHRQAPRAGFAADFAQAVDLQLQGAVLLVARQLADQAPGPVVVGVAGLRSAGAGQAAHGGYRCAVGQAEVAAPVADIHEQRQVAVAAQRADAQLAQVMAVRRLVAIDQADEGLAAHVAGARTVAPLLAGEHARFAAHQVVRLVTAIARRVAHRVERQEFLVRPGTVAGDPLQ